MHWRRTARALDRLASVSSVECRGGYFQFACKSSSRHLLLIEPQSRRVNLQHPAWSRCRIIGTWMNHFPHVPLCQEIVFFLITIFQIIKVSSDGISPFLYGNIFPIPRQLIVITNSFCDQRKFECVRELFTVY